MSIKDRTDVCGLSEADFSKQHGEAWLVLGKFRLYQWSQQGHVNHEAHHGPNRLAAVRLCKTDGAIDPMDFLDWLNSHLCEQPFPTDLCAVEQLLTDIVQRKEKLPGLGFAKLSGSSVGAA